MLAVFKVDETTRLILPGSAWGYAVREKLSAMGHTVRATDQDPSSVLREAVELEAVDKLLDSTGL